MRTILLNDTTRYHKGCGVVIKSLKERFKGIEKTYCTSDIGVKNLDFSQFDRVILNGEGTLHHNRGTARRLLESLAKAQRSGCKTILTNTVWQEMNNQWAPVLNKCDLIEVREVFSKKAMEQIGVTKEIKVVPDASYFYNVDETPYLIEEYEFQSIYQGGYVRFEGFRNIPNAKRIDIFTQEWDEIVNRLRNARLLITGRHHEMYAACVARCHFLVYPGNTWKNEGLLKSADVKIPFGDTLTTHPNKFIKEILDGVYDEEYQKLWDYLNGHNYYYKIGS